MFAVPVAFVPPTAYLPTGSTTVPCGLPCERDVSNFVIGDVVRRFQTSQIVVHTRPLTCGIPCHIGLKQVEAANQRRVSAALATSLVPRRAADGRGMRKGPVVGFPLRSESR